MDIGEYILVSIDTEAEDAQACMERIHMFDNLGMLTKTVALRLQEERTTVMLQHISHQAFLAAAMRPACKMIKSCH